MKLTAFLMSLLLSACAIDAPLVRDAPSTTVELPLAVRCVELKDLDPVPVQATAEGDHKQKTARAAVELAQSRKYIQRADVMLRACATGDHDAATSK